MAGQRAPIVVVTGSSAGIGRATAVAFGRRAWNVALIARSRSGLDGACRDVEAAGGAALAIRADVADATAMFEAADQVLARWGAIDVWVNNAMTSIFSPVDEIAPDEFRRVTEVTYLGCVFGTMAALRCMRPRGAGTIVQVGSALSYRAIPLQSAYCGSKFAIRGFTDAVRSELRHDRSAIRITMVQLPATNTPQFDWVRNNLSGRAQPLGRIYDPQAAAEAIFRASQRAPRELWVGFPVVQAILGTMVFPGLLDRFLARKGYEGQASAEPKPTPIRDNLFEPAEGVHAIRGRFVKQARPSVAAVSATTVMAAGGALLACAVATLVLAI